MGKMFLLISFLFSVHYSTTVYAQCDSDSVIYKLILNYYRQNNDNIKKKYNLLTIDYRPEYPYVLGVDLKKWGVDSLTYNRLLQLNDTLSIEYHASCLNRMFQDDPEVIVLNKEDYVKKKFTAKNFWKRFWKLFPESIGQTFVSAIAYNENCTKAIFYYECASHWLVGEGCFAICYFENEEWIIKDIIGVLQM